MLTFALLLVVVVQAFVPGDKTIWYIAIGLALVLDKLLTAMFTTRNTKAIEELNKHMTALFDRKVK